ncbi:AAA family ATPase [Chitinophaga vietnamensis]|uniref:AAA family ATPase n=1 Tax=Chitinophaga vietnamensis TaxID=2593957 RepID=UPI001177F679|nr:ATP-binding protein [Chitinophaga vietnamensis]
MIIRLLVKNLYSFNDLTEFNLLPGRFSRLAHHVSTHDNVELLKLSVIYGANGAGKSNLINTLSLLRDFVKDGEMPIEFITETFKFDKKGRTKDVYIGIEFFKDETPYYYGLTINQGIIIEEELFISGLGTKDDKILFTRRDTVDGNNLELQFSPEVEDNKETAFFSSFLKNEILGRNKLVLFHMKSRQNEAFGHHKNAANWFENGIEMISPLARPHGLCLRLEKDATFFKFATDILRSFNTGIEHIHIETVPIEEYFGEDDRQEANRFIANLKANPERIASRRNAYEEVIFVMEDNKPVAKSIWFSHNVDKGTARFMFSEESDGTRRLMEYLPALYSIVNKPKTFLIDEIERSIHPLLIKEIIKKFSLDTATKGQLIFSTHESNLLDQEIFRPDEIWFAEKNNHGATELYPLSEFKEHHTIDIRKGYLNGRYGAIPFLGNFVDLNWEKYAKTK